MIDAEERPERTPEARRLIGEIAGLAKISGTAAEKVFDQIIVADILRTRDARYTVMEARIAALQKRVQDALIEAQDLRQELHTAKAKIRVLEKSRDNDWQRFVSMTDHGRYQTLLKQIAAKDRELRALKGGSR